MADRDWPKTQDELTSLDPIKFEEFVADVWQARGYDAKVTQASNDAGKDVIADRDGDRVAIQAKRYQEYNRVGGPEVQQYSSMLHDEAVDHVVIVTSSTFTTAAYRRGQEVGVDLVDGERLLSLASQYRGTSESTSTSTSDSSPSSSGSPLTRLLLLPIQITLVWAVIVYKLLFWYVKLLLRIFTWPFRK